MRDLLRLVCEVPALLLDLGSPEATADLLANSLEA